MPLCDLTRIYDKSLVVPFYYCFKFNIDTTIFTLLGRSHHLLEPSPSVLSMVNLKSNMLYERRPKEKVTYYIISFM